MEKWLKTRFGRALMTGLATYLPAIWSVGPVLQARAAGGTEPLQFRWQIERIGNGQGAFIQTGFRSGDLALGVIDIPQMFFPTEITEVHVWWASEVQSPYHVATNIVFYDADGFAQYVLEGAVLTSGLNRIRLGVECDTCQVIFDRGPIAIAVQYLTEFAANPPISQGSGHILTSGAGCWQGYNHVFDAASETWLQPCPGLNGNFGIRAEFQPLCAQRIGDANGDSRVGLPDHLWYAPRIAGPGVDIWDYDSIYGDTDGDWDLDLRDWATLQNNFTGLGNVPCGGSARERISSEIRSARTGEVVSLASGIAALPRPVSALREGLDSDVGVVAGGWNLRQISVAIAIAAVVITLIIGPCVQSTCRNVNRSGFMAGSSDIEDGSVEEVRIRKAMDRLEEWGSCDSVFEDAWFRLSDLQFYNPWLGNPRINYQASEDDIEFAASRLFEQVVIHHSFITGEHWNAAVDEGGEDLAVSALALLLFAEWQHIDQPQLTERQCQVEYLRAQDRLIQCHEIPHRLNPGFGHGFGD